MLAKGIVQLAEALGSVRSSSSILPSAAKLTHGHIGDAIPMMSYLSQDKVAIMPLYDLLTRFAPDLSYLTPIHPIFITVSTPLVLAQPINAHSMNLRTRTGLCRHLLLHCRPSRAGGAYLADINYVVSGPPLPGSPGLSLHRWHCVRRAEAICGGCRVF
jgi:hypothetical protein